MSLTRIICSSALALLTAAGGQPAADGRITRPEGYLQLEGPSEGDRGNEPNAAGSFSVTHAPPRDARERGLLPDDEPEPDLEAIPVPPKRKSAAQLCQPLLDRFAARLSELRGDPVVADGGATPLNPNLQRAMFGRIALRGNADPSDQVIPELTWDDELKELNRDFRKCMKAQSRR